MTPDRFVTVGRGGAGNARTVSAPPQQATKDPEAPRKKSIDTIHQHREPATYVHGGRGGAGNLFSPAGSSKSSELEPADVVGAGVGRASLIGRGGIGNFEALKSKARITDIDVELGENPRQTDFGPNAESGIRSPKKVFLGNGRQSERGEN